MRLNEELIKQLADGEIVVKFDKDSDKLEHLSLILKTAFPLDNSVVQGMNSFYKKGGPGLSGLEWDGVVWGGWSVGEIVKNIEDFFIIETIENNFVITINNKNYTLTSLGTYEC